ncbi:hypothetical protein GCM10023222_49630 [Saccharopolyspora cebuensis]|uniref:Zinc finger protein n=1 Tax=Saccharopolyspora cebuensis TaxID=418759 RepID=A0ABV4CH45_9PSEU
MTYQPHPFRWVPGDGARHATTAPRCCECGEQTEVETLCGVVVKTDRSELAWLWRTCAPCNTEAHKIVRQRKAGAW